MSNQVSVSIIDFDFGDKTVTLRIGNRRFEFFLKEATWFSVNNNGRIWEGNGWTNYLLTRVIEGATAIYIDGKRADRRAREELKTMVDYRKTPSEEFSFTVIATEAQGITYKGGRQWMKTKDDAQTFAGEIFELEKNSGRSFELAIVQCIDVVKRKPQIEMVSTFKKSSAESEG